MHPAYSQNSSFSVTYNPELSTLEVFNNKQEKIGILREEDFNLVPRCFSSPLMSTESPIDQETSHEIKCLEINEQRLHFAKSSPLANRAFSIISGTCIGFLAIPWLAGGMLVMVATAGAPLAIDKYSRWTEKTYNRIKPVFLETHLQKSIEQQRSKMAALVQKIDEKFTENYYNNLKLTHQKKKEEGKNLEDAGEIHWYQEDIKQIKIIAQYVLNKTLEQPE